MTARENTKTAIGYIVCQTLHDDSYIEIECKLVDEIRTHNQRYPYKKKEKVKILSSKVYGYASFDIGK